MPSLPLHLDVREVLREQLGDRLLPFALRRAAGSERGAGRGHDGDGLRPQLHRGEDFGSLAGWVKS